jgi:N-formylglutamate deformylase
MEVISVPYSLSDTVPAGQTALVIDSPHSGRWLPARMLVIANPDDGAAVEDRFVDELFLNSPEYGAAFLQARVSRRYLDLNRHPDGKDGLIRPWPQQPDPLPKAEIDRRVQEVWQPYHQRLATILKDRRVRFGRVLHLNVHSMPGTTRDSSGNCPDIVLGNRHGQSADGRVMQIVADVLRAQGLRVALNDPYSGVEILRRHGNPAGDVHSVQLEVSRALFLDEVTGAKSQNFTACREVLTTLVAELAQRYGPTAQAAE